MLIIEDKESCFKTDGTVNNIKYEIADTFSLNPFDLRFIESGRQLKDEEYTENAIVTNRIRGGVLPAVIPVTYYLLGTSAAFAALGIAGPVVGHVMMTRDLKAVREEELRHQRILKQMQVEQRSKTEMSYKTSGLHEAEVSLAKAETQFTKGLVHRAVIDGTIEIEELTRSQIDLIEQADKLKLRDEYVKIWKKKVSVQQTPNTFWHFVYL